MRAFKIFTIASILILGGIWSWSNLYISEKEHTVTDWNSIYTSGPVNVFIEKGVKESVIIRADDNIHNNVVVEVINGELKVYTQGSIRSERVLDAYITYTHLDSVHAAAQSTLTARGIVASQNLNVRAAGASEIKLQLETDTLDLIMTGAANVQLAGNTEYFDLAINHVGDLMAYNLVSQDCKVKMHTGDQSPGIARINAEKTLDVSIKGPRLLKYKGGAKVIREEIEGGGRYSEFTFR